MLINKDEIARKVLSGEIASMEDLNGVLRSMIKDVVETAMGAELTDFLGYEKNRTATSGMDNRRNGYSPVWPGGVGHVRFWGESPRKNQRST